MDEIERGQLQRLEEKVDAIRARDLPDLRVYVAGELAALRVKAGIWGAIAGAIAAIVPLIAMLLRRP